MNAVVPAGAAELGADVARALLTGNAPPAPEVNDRLRLLAREDPSAAVVAWRPISNAYRLHAIGTMVPELLDGLADGAIIASAFTPDRARAERVGSHWRLTASDLLVTGAEMASHVLVEATSTCGTVVLAVPSDEIYVTGRPEFAGLVAASNVLIGIDTVLPGAACLTSDGAAFVEMPYSGGLTMGAIAVGAAEPLLGLLGDLTAAEQGALTAELAAARALVERSGSIEGDAGWWSRAAKVAATSIGLRLADRAVALSGPGGYAAKAYARTRRDDLEGLRWQAPREPGAAVRLLVP
jgi:alkylation response protein AidB-like acyl-CoA dehydrogenase